MKKITSSILFFIILSGCRLATAPTPISYSSIVKSKEADAFINQYRPEAPYLRIGGRDYHINEAWIEHPHYEGTFSDKITSDSTFVVSLYIDTSDHTDLHLYVKEMGNGCAKIWFNLKRNIEKDTIVVFYKQALDSLKKNKTFLFFKDTTRILH